jgi:hypothetical protein
MNGTDAVNLFLEICVVAGWVAEPIPETPDHESADFLVVTGRGRYFAEVKQLNANADEAIKEAEIEAGKIIVVHHEPGDRLRPLIKKANSQIKAVADPGTPGLLVVYDSRKISPIEPYDVLTAMYGLQAVVVNVPPDPNIEPTWGGERFAGKRGVSPAYNRSISAVAVVPQQPRPATVLYVFHNDYARVGFDTDTFRVPSFRQFRRSTQDPARFADWQGF